MQNGNNPTEPIKTVKMIKNDSNYKRPYFQNNQKQKLYVAVECKGRALNSTYDEIKWGKWSEPENIFEPRIVANVCHLFETNQFTPSSLEEVST